MCFHSKQSKDAQTLEHRFNAQLTIKEGFQSNHFNGFTYPKTPVIANAAPDKIQLFNWGLIPNWAKDKTIQAYTLNAKIETILEKPSFRNNVKNRCLVIVDGFTEWQWLDAKGKKKQPYLITLPTDEAFAFAGIWSEWVDKETGEMITTYSIVTTQANELMSEIHNNKKRMPIILTPQNEREWLNGNSINDFMKCNVELKAKPI